MPNYDDERDDVETIAEFVDRLVTDEEFYRTTGLPNETDEEYASRHQKYGNTRQHTSRNWCFTWNNYPETFEESLLHRLQNWTYICWGKEVAPTTGTPHLQGFVVFRSDQRFGTRKRNGTYDPRTLKGRIPEVYWKPMYSNPDACIKYCSKDGDFTEHGTRPRGAGSRTDLELVCNALVDERNTLEDVARMYPQQYIKYSGGMTKFYTLLQKDRETRPLVVWLTGPSGTGKTECVYRFHDRECVYTKRDGTIYWSDYDQRKHSAILINEFAPYTQANPRGWVFTDFLQVLDRYQEMVQVKYGYAKVNTETVYITSFKHPKDMGYTPDELTQIYRRLDMIYIVKNPQEIEEYQDGTIMYYREDLKVAPTFTSPLLEKMAALGQMKAARAALARAKVQPTPQIAAKVQSEASSIYSDELSRRAPSETLIRQYSDE